MSTKTIYYPAGPLLSEIKAAIAEIEASDVWQAKLAREAQAEADMDDHDRHMDAMHARWTPSKE